MQESIHLPGLQIADVSVPISAFRRTSRHESRQTNRRFTSMPRTHISTSRFAFAIAVLPAADVFDIFAHFSLFSPSPLSARLASPRSPRALMPVAVLSVARARPDARPFRANDARFRSLTPPYPAALARLPAFPSSSLPCPAPSRPADRKKPDPASRPRGASLRDRRRVGRTAAPDVVCRRNDSGVSRRARSRGGWSSPRSARGADRPNFRAPRGLRHAASRQEPAPCRRSS